MADIVGWLKAWIDVLTGIGDGGSSRYKLCRVLVVKTLACLGCRREVGVWRGMSTAVGNAFCRCLSNSSAAVGGMWCWTGA